MSEDHKSILIGILLIAISTGIACAENPEIALNKDRPLPSEWYLNQLFPNPF